MKGKLEKLIEQSNEWFKFMSNYIKDQEAYNNFLINKGLKLGAFNPEFRKMIIARDTDYSSMPYIAATGLIDNDVTQEDLQASVDSIDKFKGYDPDTFSHFGAFLSVMMDRVLRNVPEIVIRTGNTNQVHIPKFFMSSDGTEGSYPLYGLEEMKEYQRDNLLISYLASRISHGKISIEGNVGNFFGAQNNGSIIKLNGECGWRSCFGHVKGETTINGEVGHDLCDGANGGKIYINGNIRSIGSYYTTAYGHSIYHNGKLIPKEDVGVPSKNFKDN